MRQDTYDVRQSTANLRETDKSQEWKWTVGKTQDRKNLRSQNGVTINCKGFGKSNLAANVVWSSHIECIIHWFPRKKQKVTALDDTEAECTLIIHL